MSISAAKSVMILLKGTLDIRRPPTVKMEEDSVKLHEAARYLDVIFSERFDMLPHISFTQNEILIRFAELAKMAKANWRLKFKSLQMLYKCVFLPKATYAAAGWWDKVKVKESRWPHCKGRSFSGLPKAQCPTKHFTYWRESCQSS